MSNNNPYLPNTYQDLYRAAFGSAQPQSTGAEYVLPTFSPGVLTRTSPAWSPGTGARGTSSVHTTVPPALTQELTLNQVTDAGSEESNQDRVATQVGGTLDITLSPQGVADVTASPARSATAQQGPRPGTAEVSISAMPAANSSTLQITITGAEERGVPASALAGLSIAQLVDLDADALAIKIEHQHCMTKKAILDHVMELKSRLLAAQAAALEDERRAGAARMAAKQEELSLALHDLAGSRAQGADLQDMMWRAACTLDHAKARRRGLLLLLNAFYGWRQHVQGAALGRMRMARAERWHTREHLQRHILRAWRRTAAALHRVTLAGRYASQLEQARELIGSHYGEQIADLRRQLSDAGAALAREAEARAKLEDNMKRAFMRGVCALNIEAMSLMKRGSLPDGANPFPLVVGSGPGSGAPEGTAMAAIGGAAAGGMRGVGYASPRSGGMQEQQPPDAAAAHGSGMGGVSNSSSVSHSAPRMQGGGGGAGSYQSVSGQAPAPVSGARIGGHSPAGMATAAGTAAARAPTLSTHAGQVTRGGGGGGMDATASPALRDTAANFYTRPQVVVTRGPAGEVPKPRSALPQPLARLPGMQH